MRVTKLSKRSILPERNSLKRPDKEQISFRYSLNTLYTNDTDRKHINCKNMYIRQHTYKQII